MNSKREDSKKVDSKGFIQKEWETEKDDRRKKWGTKKEDSKIKGLLTRCHIYKTNLTRFKAKYPGKELVYSNFENDSKIRYTQTIPEHILVKPEILILSIFS